MQIVEALREGRVHDIAGVPAADVTAALDAFSGDERANIERLLTHELPRTVEPMTAGKKAHDLRAEKRTPWWAGVSTALPAPLHPEPARDVEVAGVKFTKDDVTSMLRSIGRFFADT